MVIFTMLPIFIAMVPFKIIGTFVGSFQEHLSMEAGMRDVLPSEGSVR